jgi:hypothetical protein
MNPFRLITSDDITMVSAIAGQAVLSTESIDSAHQYEKNQLAEELTISILDDIGLASIPDNLINIAVKAARYSVEQSR